MTEKQADVTDNPRGAALKFPSGVLRRRPLAPYDYTIEGARLGNLTGRQLKTLVERLEDESGAALAKRLMAENH